MTAVFLHPDASWGAIELVALSTASGFNIITPGELVVGVDPGTPAGDLAVLGTFACGPVESFVILKSQVLYPCEIGIYTPSNNDVASLKRETRAREHSMRKTLSKGRKR